MNLIVSVLAAACVALPGRETALEISTEVDADVSRPVRPGKPPVFWNGRSVLFMHPPAFGFPKVEGAQKYAYRIEDDARHVCRFEAMTPDASLAPVWMRLPVGMLRLEVLGIGRNGRVCGQAGYRRFWKSAAFDPSACPEEDASGFSEAATRYFDWLFDMPNTQSYLTAGVPDEDYTYNSFPCKTDSAVIKAFVSYAALRPERRAAALKVACRAADHLLSLTMPAGSPLEHFPRTYVVRHPRRPSDQAANDVASRYEGLNMLVYPATVGSAYLALYGAVKDRKYLDAAIRIARTYARLQGEDGTWFLKIGEKDGRPVAPNRLFPLGVCDFLEELHDVTGDRTFRDMSDRAFAFVEKGPLADWNWEAQFEDVEPSGPYRNLTVHTPVSAALHLLKRYPDDPGRRSLARECLRFAEDQFVLWKPPYRPDGTGPLADDTPMILKGTADSWFDVPGVCEQYDWYLPIDSAAAKMICGYLAFYRAEGRAVDLAKAQALGRAITVMQSRHGRGGAIPTHWLKWEVGAETSPWINCGIYTANVLRMLSEVAGGGRAQVTFDVRDFGARGDGRAKDTAAIQAAVDAAEAAGGGRVVVPAGRYLTGSIYLKDNVDLHLTAEAELVASTDRADYNAPDVCPQNATSRVENTSGAHLILAIEKRNVAVSGPGLIDGRADFFLLDPATGRNWPNGHRGIPWRPSQMLYFVECENVRLSGVRLRGAPYWSCFLHGCDYVQVRGLDVRTCRAPRTLNGDGIDIDCCRFVTVADCFVETDDDSITLRASGARLRRHPQECAYVTVTNCTLSSACDAIRVGVGDGRIHDATFTGIAIRDSRTAINVVAGYVAGHGTDVSDILFENMRVDCADFCRIHHMRSREAEIGRLAFRNVSGRTTALSRIWANAAKPFGRIAFEKCDLPDAGVEAVNAPDVVFRDSSFRRVPLTEAEHDRRSRSIDRGEGLLW